ncbi:LCP family protein [Alkalibaculum bacchi]|uniref:LCP family protein n=1 Tax=Alkalibaculum bacchi TaxID=645887 RepID=UPI0026F04A6B|nr:LCP family protein [Alkalibaculum bacchi]
MATKKKERSTGKKVLIGFLALILLISAGGIYLFDKYLGDMSRVDISKNDEELNISPESSKKDDKIINIALFGIDTRANDYDSATRSDTIMIASLDKQHKKIKLTSIMRDTYVNIPDRGYDKINHSYAFGGPELAIKTINKNFDMNIKNYVTVNFSAMAKIVDAIGGVEIDVKDYEIRHLPGVNSTGLQNLSGDQAVSYSRIRYSGDGDYERTQRQRKVLENVIYKVLDSKSLTQALALIETLTPNVETSLSTVDMVGLATDVFSSNIKTLENTRLPLDEYSKGGTWNGVYYLKPNSLVDNVKYLHEFIYEDGGYQASGIVNEISDGI